MRWGKLAGVLFLAHWVVDAAVVLVLALGGSRLTGTGFQDGEPVQIPAIVVDQPPSRLLDIAEQVGGSVEIAEAVAREADRSGLSDELIVGVMLVENEPLDVDTVNWYGAVGLMQVVEHLHMGEYPQCGTDLTDIDTNVCYGVHVLQEKLRLTDGDLTEALLLYSGCSGPRRTRSCEHYPVLVADAGGTR